jgi:hypothetical protein
VGARLLADLVTQIIDNLARAESKAELDRRQLPSVCFFGRKLTESTLGDDEVGYPEPKVSGSAGGKKPPQESY